MAVYFIRDTSSGMIKIGHASDPWARLSYIQVSSPTDLEMLAVEDGGYDRERELHQTYADARRRGEWFEPVIGLIGHIATLEPAVRPASATRDFWNGHSSKELAEKLGCSASMLSHICNGIRRPSPEFAIRIQRACGVSAIKLVFGELADEAA